MCSTKASWKRAVAESLILQAPGHGEVSGLYFADCNPVEGTKHVTDDAMTARLWTASAKLTRDYLPAARVEPVR